MFLNCPGVCATAGVAASAALATATEALASFMNLLRSLDIFSLPADLSSPFLRRPLMIIGRMIDARKYCQPLCLNRGLKPVHRFLRPVAALYRCQSVSGHHLRCLQADYAEQCRNRPATW